MIQLNLNSQLMNTQYMSTIFEQSSFYIPFDKISVEDYLPAIKKGIAEGKEEIQRIITNDQKPSFENTIVAMENSGQLLNKVCEVFFNINSANTSPKIQELAQEISPLLTQYQNDISLNSQLFERVKSVYENQENENLDVEDTTLLENVYKGFTRNGALLTEEKKESLRKIDEELSLSSLKFGENVLAENNSYELHILNEDELEGLPKSAIEAAKSLAKEKEKDGYIFTLDYPSYIPLVTYAKNREIRKEITKASGSKAFKNNEFNNEQLVLTIVKLRHERAQLLGYNSHAEFVLERRMASDPNTVTAFSKKLQDASKPFAEIEQQKLIELAKKDGINDYQKWDQAYYSEKLKQKEYNFDSEELRPYLKLENVINGVFLVAEKLFGLTFKANQEIPTYHEDVLAYDVFDELGKQKAIFLADYFPRSSKRQGAWMTSYRGQFKRGDEEQLPVVSIVCNFTKPTESKPSLLTFEETTTLFHEFGHALHGLLANGKYESISGTNVYWDFVELPSQILENWCYEKECLDLFAKHYETGASIPQELIDKIKESANFNSGIQTLRQVSLGQLDMAWHTENGVKAQSVKEYEEEAFKATALLPSVEESILSCQFSHIFQGGYSAGYYSYKWAEVLSADGFEYFKEKGIFNPEVANKFKKHILSAGGSEHPMTLYKRFRGKEPDVNALLRHAGLINKN